MKKTSDIIKSKVKNAIKDFLTEHGKTRANELKREIVNKKKLCSEKIFWDCISELNRRHEIEKQEITGQKVWYAIANTLFQEKQWLEEYSDFEKYMEETFKQMKIPPSKLKNPPTLGESIKEFYWVFTQITHKYEVFMLASQFQRFSKVDTFNDVRKTKLPKLFDKCLDVLDVISKHYNLRDHQGNTLTTNKHHIISRCLDYLHAEEIRNTDFMAKMNREFLERLSDEGKITPEQFLDFALKNERAFPEIRDNKKPS